jgi:hypothetical protein
MLPKWHALYGLIFSLLLFILLDITLFQTLLVFFGTFFIDFDHYLWYISKKRDLNLRNSYNFLKNFERYKKHLMVFHTIEFLILVVILAYFFNPFLFILIGILFHSILDLIYLGYERRIDCREFSIINSLMKNP